MTQDSELRWLSKSTILAVLLLTDLRVVSSELPSEKKLQLAANVVFYTYKWLQFAVAEAA